MRLSSFPRPISLLILLACAFVSLAEPMPPPEITHEGTLPPPQERVVLPESVPDPFEPMNRMFWMLNNGLMKSVGHPSSRVYRAVVIKPVRRGINNFGRNIRYPGHLVNNLLQAKWTGARDETYRFLCNSVIGVGGLFDVATRWDIPRSEANFGQTFGMWGWEPNFYLFLPVRGPSNDRDALGLAADNAANPLAYFPPYAYANLGIAYNEYTGVVDELMRFTQTEMDGYSVVQYATTFARDVRTPDFHLDGEQDRASLETLQTLFFRFRNPEFPNRGRTHSVLIPATGKKLKFTFWLQPQPAPVVYIVPGLGSHRLVSTALGLAELVHEHGFSAVCVSSVFHAEFMEHASTAAMPAYAPADSRDLQEALAAIHSQLEGRYPGRLGSKALLGYSMGGFHSLLIAAAEAETPDPVIAFDRYLAINTPVRLLYGVSKLDEFYQAPLEWPSSERIEKLENTFLKAASFVKSAPSPGAVLPLSAVESKFLIGLAFRVTLRDVIFSSQKRNDQGVLTQPLNTWRREPVFHEILQYSYQDYLKYFVLPYYRDRGIDLSAPGVLEEAGDLRTHRQALQASSNVRLIQNENDFLLSDADLDWLRATFTGERLTVFEQGGHLGNLAHPLVQNAVIEALEGLKAGPIKAAPRLEAGSSERLSFADLP
jgi:ABC-type transporter lipoprotein component MlaA/pimeloyl-ACP methyl ester carboxylesterase